MRPFMDRDFLLTTETARHLYNEYAAKQPIIDYHCHLDPREIYEDRQFENMTQLWLGADHYKWRLMRAMGVDERFITGDAPDREKFQKWAETLGLAIGNPLYHWSHLELMRYFGCGSVLNGETAETVWQFCNDRLKEPGFSARGLILRSGVEVICTTDDPADTLEWHRKIAADDSFAVKVLPSFRPDRALGIEKEDYCEYTAGLGEAAGISIGSYDELLEALTERLDCFVSLGCRVSDHGLGAVPYAPASEQEADEIFRKRLGGGMPSAEEIKRFKTALLLALGRAYAARGIAMQLHFGVMRDDCRRIYDALGPDAGIDSIGDRSSVRELAGFLNALDETGELPRTILYSLDPGDNAAIDTVMGCFQGGCRGRMQHGIAWWFNDHKDGITEHLKGLAARGILATSIGMLTDSRSFLSYARHEYFRRILCDIIGTWVESGEFPCDEAALRQIVEGICRCNAKEYFGL